MSEGKKWAIAGSGGGLKCVEGAGIRYRLAERGHPHPDIEVDISGNIPNAAYAIADQHHLSWKIWIDDLLNDPEFVRLDRMGEFISVDRMVDHEFTKRCPLDERALSRTGTEFFFATTDETTGKTHYFRNEDVRKGISPKEIIRAGTAHIGLTRREPVEIAGKRYSDAVTSATLKDCIQVALEAGADFVVAIDCNDDTLRKKFRRDFAASGWTDKVALLQPDIKQEEKDKGQSAAQMLSTNPQDLRNSFYAASRAVLQHPLIQKFLPDRLSAGSRSAA